MVRQPRDTQSTPKKNPTAEGISDEANGASGKRAYLRQTDVPNGSLDEALRVPLAIFEQYAGRPTSPLYIAKALTVDPKGSQLRVLAGASIAFGLIEGGAQAASISPTDLARRIIKPQLEGEDLIAKREAVLRPRVFGDFLRKYDGNAFPRRDIALNVLESMGVPRTKVEEVYDRIESSARSVGYLQEIKSKLYVVLNGDDSGDDTSSSAPPREESDVVESAITRENAPSLSPVRALSLPTASTRGSTLATAFEDDQRRRRVFITHGRDRALVDPIRKLLEYGEMEPVISVERQSVSKPVPEKIMDDMRKCGAAIIHVDNEMVLKDGEGNEHAVLNPNVLIEIGAAMAFYGQRFILLVRDGVKLPSNLQGLYEVRYSNDTLDAAATIKLLEAMKDVKNYTLPGEVDLEG